MSETTPGGRRKPSAAPPRDPVAEEAQARLDQIRTQAGGALSGGEIARRIGRAAEEEGSPPLDWRLTPRTVVLQLLAVALFIGVVWFMVSLAVGGVVAVFGR